MEWESDSPCRSHTYPGQGHWSPGKCSGWELENRNCGAIPGRGLLLTAERWIEGMWGRRLWWEILVEESQAAMKTRQYCWVRHRGWSHHALLTPWHQQLSNREASPSNAWCPELQSRIPPRVPLKVPVAPKNREGPQAREPSKCLNWQSYGERLAKEAFWSQL